MAQWEKLRQLDSVSRQPLDDLYIINGDVFPMDVRHYLAPWIEKQEWKRAKQEYDLALLLFQALLENMDIQHGRFSQEESRVLLQHNFRRLKQNFQIYQEDPCRLANNILWFLEKEKVILENAELAEKVQLLQVQQNPMETDSRRNVQCKVDSLRNKVERMESTVKFLEEQQDEFSFKMQINKLTATKVEEEKKKAQSELQTLLNRLDGCRKSMLAGLVMLLDEAEELVKELVEEEVQQWRRRQQRSCIGAPENTCLERLEKWFTAEADCLFWVRTFLKKLDEMREEVTYHNDPVLAQKPGLQKRVDHLLETLLKSAFVVETQPSMPQGKGPLVLRTNVQFSVKTRLLVKVPELNHAMKVKVSIDRDAPQVRGYRRFNLLHSTDSKALNTVESVSGGMVADFRHLSLKEQKSAGGGGGGGGNNLSLSVTEELHVIDFDTVFELHGFKVELQTSSLPVVIISNSSQQQSAWASVLWFNRLSDDPKNIRFFANCPVATWPQFVEMLSWQLLSATTRGLDAQQMDMIAHKLFGKKQSYEVCTVSWPRFSKEHILGTTFTFWAWFDGILVMVKTYLKDLWSDGCIMGFVRKGKEKSLLRKKRRGTFLLRFSESIRDGGITFSWVDYSPSDEADVQSVRPFTKTDLEQIPFHEIIRHFQILIPENVPESPLCFLYPDTPKDQAFGKYYKDKGGDESPYLEYIKTKLVLVGFKENTLEAKSPMNSEADGLNGIHLYPHPPPLELLSNPDPMLPSPDPMLPPCPPFDEEVDLLPSPTVDTLQEFLNDPNIFQLNHGEFPEVSLDGFTSALMQSCIGGGPDSPV